MYVLPPKPLTAEEEAELALEQDKEKVAKILLARGMSPRVVSKRTGLPVEQVQQTRNSMTGGSARL